MKKRIIIGAIALVLAVALVFGVVAVVKGVKRKAISDFMTVASVYFEATKTGNNELMSIADTYDNYSAWGDFEEATKQVEERLGKYNGLSFEVDKAYEEVKNYEIKYEEAREIKAIAETHYAQYKKFEDNILNHSEENYGEDYGKVYKEWQIPFADEHHKLRFALAE